MVHIISQEGLLYDYEQMKAMIQAPAQSDWLFKVLLHGIPKLLYLSCGAAESITKWKLKHGLVRGHPAQL